MMNFYYVNDFHQIDEILSLIKLDFFIVLRICHHMVGFYHIDEFSSDWEIDQIDKFY